MHGIPNKWYQILVLNLGLCWVKNSNEMHIITYIYVLDMFKPQVVKVDLLPKWEGNYVILLSLFTLSRFRILKMIILCYIPEICAHKLQSRAPFTMDIIKRCKLSCAPPNVSMAWILYLRYLQIPMIIEYIFIVIVIVIYPQNQIIICAKTVIFRVVSFITYSIKLDLTKSDLVPQLHPYILSYSYSHSTQTVLV